MKRKDENEGRLAPYERTKGRKRKRLAHYEGRKDENKNGLRITKDEERKHEGCWMEGGRGEMVSERRIYYSTANGAKNAKFYLSTTFVSDG